jgi:hypothetical protein
MGDGGSDLPVMMHVNQHDGLTIALSEAKFISRVDKRTVLSANAVNCARPCAGKCHELEVCRNTALLYLLRAYVGRMGQDAHGHTHNSRLQSATSSSYLMTTPRHIS